MYLQKLSQQTELVNQKGSSYQLPESSSLQTIVDQEMTGEEVDTEMMMSDEEHKQSSDQLELLTNLVAKQEQLRGVNKLFQTPDFMIENLLSKQMQKYQDGSNNDQVCGQINGNYPQIDLQQFMSKASHTRKTFLIG